MWFDLSSVAILQVRETDVCVVQVPSNATLASSGCNDRFFCVCIQTGLSTNRSITVTNKQFQKAQQSKVVRKINIRLRVSKKKKAYVSTRRHWHPFFRPSVTSSPNFRLHAAYSRSLTSPAKITTLIIALISSNCSSLIAAWAQTLQNSRDSKHVAVRWPFLCCA